MITTATVSVLDDERLIRDGETAVDQYNRSRDHARKQIMPMARGLLAAKRKYPATQDFGDWLYTSSYREIGPDDRAALIKIGEHDGFSSKFVRTTSLVSPRTIWDAIEELLPTSHHANSTDQDPQNPEIDVTPVTEPLEQHSESDLEKEFENPAQPAYQVAGTGGRDPIKDLSKAELVRRLDITTEDYLALFGCYPPNRQRALRGEFLKLIKNKKNNGKATAIKLFRFALNLAQSGHIIELTNHKQFDARIFMPRIPAGLAQSIPFKQLVDRFDYVQAMNDRCAELEAAQVSASDLHMELNHLWQTGKKLPPRKKEFAVSETDSKSRIKHEVKFCGEVIWPRESLRHVTYEDLNAGWHLVHYWLGHLEHATPQKPKEIAVQIRHLIWDIKEASSIPGLIDVMLACMAAYSKHNENKLQADLSACVPPGKSR